MLVKELPFRQTPALLQGSHLWGRDIGSLQTVDLQVFLRLHWGTGAYHSALSQVSSLVDAVWEVVLNSGEGAPKFLYFEVPKVQLTCEELRQWLGEVSIIRRRAILFALETELDLSDVVNLTWKSVKLMNLGEIASALVETSTRHFKLEYVFWEPMSNKMGAAPLFGLEQSALEVSQGMGMTALRRLYKNIVPIDSQADLQHFKKIMPLF